MTALRAMLLLLAACSDAPSLVDCRVEGGRFAICGAAPDAEDAEPEPDPAVGDAADPDPTPLDDPPTDAPADPVIGDPAPEADPTTDVPGEAESEPDAEPDAASDEPDAASDEPDAEPSPCPADMVHVESFCMDRYEAPNVVGQVPFVMFHLYEAENWCEARGKRLCWDDEWSLACGGSQELTYPYGNQRVPGHCNDEEIWREYLQSLLNGWPSAASTTAMETLADQLAAARAAGTSAAAAADHIEDLYQGEAAGQNPECVGEYGVYDLVGNVEEWTLRRDGGSGPEFTGRLLGRYWAESRTCHGGVTSHGNGFRFYEIGFRCCLDPE